jgi:hypothetical protein
MQSYATDSWCLFHASIICAKLFLSRLYSHCFITSLLLIFQKFELASSYLKFPDLGLSVVEHAYNLNCIGSRGRRITVPTKAWDPVCKQTKALGMAQVVYCLPRNCKALSSNPDCKNKKSLQSFLASHS